eukprot:6314-Heterococcus_DN1.PRE.4
MCKQNYDHDVHSITSRTAMTELAMLAANAATSSNAAAACVDSSSPSVKAVQYYGAQCAPFVCLLELCAQCTNCSTTSVDGDVVACLADAVSYRQTACYVLRRNNAA